MAEEKIQRNDTVFTVGHSNHDMNTLVNLLKAQKIDVLVDIRSNPYSRVTPHFNREELKKKLGANGIKYLFLGKELGGRPESHKFYDSEGYVLYSQIAESLPFIEGIERLMRGIKTYRVALLCSEENPGHCHRHLLIGKVLTDRGVNVLHIRGDGRLQSEYEVSIENQRVKSNEAQQSLFNSKEAREWKSIRLVLQKKAPKNSSVH